MSSATQQTTTRSSHRRDGGTLGVSLYLLTFPNGKCYVGIAKRPNVRFRQHANAAENGSMFALSNAWRKYGAPAMRIIGKADHYDTAYAMEIALIEQLGTLAPNGYNMTKGGDGFILAPEVVAAMGRRRSRRYWEDEDYRARMQEAQMRGAAKGAMTRKAWYQTPEGRASIEARTSNPEWRAKIAAKNRERGKLPEVRKAASALTKAKWLDPDYRARVNAAREAKQAKLRNDPDWRARKAAKAAETMRLKWQDPEYLAKMAARKPPVLTPEAGARAVAGRLARMTPEQHSETLRKAWATRKASRQP